MAKQKRFKKIVKLKGDKYQCTEKKEHIVVVDKNQLEKEFQKVEKEYNRLKSLLDELNN